MSTLQVRDVPEWLSHQLRARAAAEGRSLSDYTLHVLEEHVRTPSREEILARLARRPSTATDEDPVAILRRMRDA